MSESAATQEVRRRYGVPDGIHLRVAGGEVLAFLPGYEVAVREVAAHPDALPAAGLGGRGGLSRVLTAEVPVLVREYRKGGMLRALRGARFHGSWRPLEELVLLRRLRAVGVPAPEAVGCVVLRRPLGWRGFLLTQEVEGAVDLEAWLHGVRAPTRRPRRELLREAGRSVRMLHDAGVLHPDLHPKNLLLTPEGGVLVLDLDGARTGDGLVTDGGRVKNLVRLARAVEKHRLKGLRAGRREALRFLEGYSGSREAAEAWLDRVRQRLRRGLALRILWWRLIGEARPWRPAVG